MTRTRVTSFSEIETEFIQRVHTVVWCSFATLDTQNRVRSRVLHPLWEGATGWIATRRHSPKEQQLAHNPHASLAYVADIVKPVYVDCLAEWDDTTASKERIWETFKAVAPPLGYDPALFFHSVDHPDYGLLRLTPWRIELFDATGETKIWHRR